MTKLFTFFAIGLMLSFPASQAIAQSGNDKVQVSALANVSAVQPGKPFWVGFKFTIAPGWHIYWKNPGDSGLPTRVKLTLPDGFTAGELKFPIPQRLVQPGDIVNYGYEDEVMLLVQITPKKDLATDRPITIRAKTTWLVCKDECMPGGSPASLELPIGDKDYTDKANTDKANTDKATTDGATVDNEDVFKRWIGRLPVKQDDDDISATTVTDHLVDGNGNAGIQITWKKVPTDLHFIPGTLHTGEISNLSVVVEKDAATGISTSKFSFDVKNKKDNAPITGLITFEKADGAKAALEISIPRESVAKKEMFDGK